MAESRPRRPGFPSWVLGAACWVLGCTASAAERLDLVCRGFDAATAVRALEGATGQPHRLGADLAGRSRAPAWFVLRQAEADTARSALAHALGAWVAGGSGTWTFTNDRSVPLGPCQVVRLTSTLAGHPEAEAIARRFLAPWLHGDAGLAWQPDGHWSATLDAAGRTQLAELLTLLDTGLVRVPSCAVTPLPPRPAGRLWDWATASTGSIAFAPDIDPQAPAADGLPVRRDGDLVTVGASATGRHPAERRQLALLPISHLGLDAETVAAAARPVVPDLPGWGVAALPWRSALLVGGDAAAIHAVLDLLDRLDRLGAAAVSRGDTAARP